MAEKAIEAKKKGQKKSSEDYTYVGMVFHRLTRHKLAMVGAFMLIFILLFVFVGPLIWRADPNTQIEGLGGLFNPASRVHPLGTDDYGRDVLAVCSSEGASRCLSASFLRSARHSLEALLGLLRVTMAAGRTISSCDSQMPCCLSRHFPC